MKPSDRENTDAPPQLPPPRAYLSVDGVISELSEDSSIPALDRGWLLGDRLIETMVGYEERVWQFSQHYERIRQAAAAVAFPWIWSEEEIFKRCTELLRTLATPQSFVRWIVSRGEGFGLRTSHQLRPHCYLYALSRQQMLSTCPDAGIRLIPTPLLPGALLGLKTGYYLPAITALAGKEAREDILWMEGEEVRESSSGNIFFVRSSCSSPPLLITPPLSSGIFPGITRKNILKLTQKRKYNVEQTSITTQHLSQFTECFITSTVQGLVAVNHIHPGHHYTTTAAGSVFRELQELYQEHINQTLS